MFHKRKRLRIAKDVIAQIHNLKNPLEVITGYYIYGDVGHLNPKTKDLSEVVDKVQKTCSVCAKGALVLSKARLYNNVSLKNIDIRDGGYINSSSYSVDKVLEEVFGTDQANAMESAFEGYCHYIEDKCVFDGGEWFDEYQDPAERLEAIMNNYIRNGAKFVIEEVIPPTN